MPRDPNPPGTMIPSAALDQVPAFAFFQVRRMHPVDLRFHAQRERGVFERLAHRHVGILQFDVLADQRDLDGRFRFADLLHQFLPWTPVRLARWLQVPVFRPDNRPRRPFPAAAALRTAPARSPWARRPAFPRRRTGRSCRTCRLPPDVRAGDDHVGRDADGAQRGHRVLGGLGLEFARSRRCRAAR